MPLAEIVPLREKLIHDDKEMLHIHTHKIFKMVVLSFFGYNIISITKLERW